MTTIYIIRHAEVVYPLDKDGNKLMYPTTVPISDEGRSQMTAFAQRLRDQGLTFDRIYTSPYARASQSAAILGSILNTSKVIEDKRLADPWIPGWIGTRFTEHQELMDKGRDIYMNPRSADQEPYEDVAKRAIATLYDIRDNNEGKTIAIVSHGDTIRLMMYRLKYPEGQIPNMSILSKYDYLKRGEAWHLTFDKGTLIEKQLLAKEGGIPGEKEIMQDSTKENIA